MAPDLNSLPPSPSPRAMPPNRQESASPRSTTSLTAAATINAADQSRRSSIHAQSRPSPHLGRRVSDRRRSQITNTLNLHDPALPSPGEMATPDQRPSRAGSFAATSPSNLGGRPTIATGDPHHHHQRQPSLGDIHNELEQEQEAQVNRMLQMIRSQQQELETLQRSQADVPGTTAVAEDAGPHSARAFVSDASSTTQSPDPAHLPPSPLDPTHRRNSVRDETAYYQAETATLTRENQMLKLRIRELEKQLTDSGGVQTSALPTSPASHSNLVTIPVMGRGEGSRGDHAFDGPGPR